MKDRLYIMFISSLLFVTVSYTQVFHKIITKQNYSFVITDNTGDAEEPVEKTSSEEDSREADRDDDFKLTDPLTFIADTSRATVKNETYSFGLLTHYPEIVPPPPKA